MYKTLTEYLHILAVSNRDEGVIKCRIEEILLLGNCPLLLSDQK